MELLCENNDAEHNHRVHSPLPATDNPQTGESEEKEKCSMLRTKTWLNHDCSTVRFVFSLQS